jgi:RimJ/RimL family protein N-acetyltransferase
MVEPRDDLGGCRPPVPALECRVPLGGSCRYEQRVPASVHPRAAGLGDRVQCLPEVGDGAAPRRDSRPRALDLTQPPLDPRPQLDDGCRRRSFRSAPWQHDLDPPRRVDRDPDATGSFGAANLVGDATGFHAATGYGAATTMTSIPDLPAPLSDGDVSLRLYEERDIPEILIAYQDDPELHVRFGQDRPPTGAQLGTQSEEGPAERAAGERLRLTIVETGSDVCRGRISVHAFEWDHRRAEIGLWLVPQVRGRGWGSRALGIASRWVFDACGIERLALLTAPENEAMLHAAATAGFTREGVLKGYVRYGRRRHDLVVMSLLPSDLESRS